MYTAYMKEGRTLGFAVALGASLLLPPKFASDAVAQQPKNQTALPESETGRIKQVFRRELFKVLDQKFDRHESVRDRETDQVQARAKLLESRFNDGYFVSALDKLSKAGISLSFLFECKHVEPEYFSAPYIDAFIKLKNEGLDVSWLIGDVDFTVTTHASFVENITNLYKGGVIGKYQLATSEGIFNKIITHSEFAEILGNLQKSSTKSSDIKSLLFIANNSPLVFAMLTDPEFMGYISANPKIADYLFSHHFVKRYADPEYIKALYQYSSTIAGMPNETPSMFALDNTYLQNMLGISWTDLLADPQKFKETLLKSSGVVKSILKDREKEVYVFFIQKMSRDVPGPQRMQDISHFDPTTKFLLIAYAGADGWPSTRNLVYDCYTTPQETRECANSLVRDMQLSGKSLLDFLVSINPTSDELSLFIEQLAQMGKLDTFFEFAKSDSERASIISQFLLGLDKISGEADKSKVASIVELVSKDLWKGSRLAILQALEKDVARLEKISHTDSHFQSIILWYSLIAAHAAQGDTKGEMSIWQKSKLKPTVICCPRLTKSQALLCSHKILKVELVKHNRDFMYFLTIGTLME
jgi:hypothetical protein